jgi:hypothetical protein
MSEWRMLWKRFRRNPWLWMAALATGALLLLALNPQRSQAIESLRGLVPFGREVRVSRFIPLTPPGVVPIGIAGAMLVWFATLGSAWLVRLARRTGWRVWVYGAAGLAAWMAFGALAWVTGLQVLMRHAWRHDGIQVTVILLYILAYVGGAYLALRFWRRDLERRCPVCLRLCGLAEARGSAAGVLLAPPEVESVCLQGHGLNVENQWGRSFGPDGLPSPLD